MCKLRELERKNIKRINKWRNGPDLIVCLVDLCRIVNEAVNCSWWCRFKIEKCLDLSR